MVQDASMLLALQHGYDGKREGSTHLETSSTMTCRWLGVLTLVEGVAQSWQGCAIHLSSERWRNQSVYTARLDRLSMCSSGGMIETEQLALGFD